MRPFQLRKWHPEEPCPCFSGRSVGNCCLTPIGVLRKKVPSTAPEPPSTNSARQGCYLAQTTDCGVKLTSEHFVSRSVLEAFSGGIRVGGLPGQAPGIEIEIGISNAGSKILCDRHNAALSPLDTEARNFFDAIEAINRDFASRSLSRKGMYRLISGEAIEFWALKAALGFYYSGIAVKDGVKLRDTHAIDFGQALEALHRHRWHPGAGLYLNAAIGSQARIRETMSMTPGISTIEKRFVGMRFSFHGLEFDLVSDAKAVTPPRWNGLIYRPSHLIFENGTRRHVLELSWLDGSRIAPATLSISRIVNRGTRNGAPRR